MSATAFLLDFNALLSSLRLYPAEHPLNLKLLDRLWQQLHRQTNEQGPLRLALHDGALLINDELFSDHPAAKALVNLLQTNHIDGFEILASLTPDQLCHFIALFTSNQLQGDQFDQQLAAAAIHAIHSLELTGASEDGHNAPRTTYQKALSCVNHLGEQILQGGVPRSGPLRQAVDSMAQELIRAPYAFFALTLIKDFDDYTYSHSVNVAVVAMTIGQACGLSADRLQQLGVGCLMHDLGKLKIDSRILRKPGPLSIEEYAQMQRHPLLGADIAQAMDDIDPAVLAIIQGHHLHYDRHGYPKVALAADHAPLVDICTVADVYDALTTLRAYRRPSSPRQALQLLQQLAGSQLHPHYVAALVQTLGDFPVGTLVRLVNNEIGLIIDQDRLDNQRALVRILRDDEGQLLTTSYDRQIDSSEDLAGEVDPLRLGIRPADWL
ncbi:HD-GYP domain-containing protein [Desulfuromonas thiophila]|uniref:Metal dependent phosphohydrolase n=1 Tax=Desulfuromonas thiophila TaxID=57664 RepID=A0A1G7A1V6_9BACT|nr:HD domain-containing phosphohydrolase [Desulfuromonas thiophila]SDE08928.1 metal dependent phosphohydrolase [Desulfuromonas thiophila]